MCVCAHSHEFRGPRGLCYHSDGTAPMLPQRLQIAIMIAAVLPSAVMAQAVQDRPAPGVTASGLRGMDRVLVPAHDGAEAVAAATGSYGYTESQGPIDGAHHRVAGRLAVGVAPARWFGVALQVDRRYDKHPDDDTGPDDGSIGDLRARSRVGFPLGGGLDVGVDLGLWLTGRATEDIRVGSVDALAALAWSGNGSPWTVAGHVGFRHDDSGGGGREPRSLRPGDRLAIGVSDFHAVLLAVAVDHRWTTVEAFGEVGWDLLIGKGAPPPMSSPLRASLGGRYHMGRSLQAELLLSVGLSSRPDQGPEDAFVPIEPRFGVGLGLRYIIGFAAPPPEREPREVVPVKAPAPEPEPVATSASVTGRLLDEEGEPVAGADIELTAGDDVRQALTDDGGGYRFNDVPLGTAHVRASHEGHEVGEWDVDVQPKMSALPDRTLKALPPMGELRGLVRSFASRAVRAKIRITSAAAPDAEPLTVSTQRDGRFEIELAPGAYTVEVRAPGFKQQVKQAVVERNGVTILIVDLRRGR